MVTCTCQQTKKLLNNSSPLFSPTSFHSFKVLLQKLKRVFYSPLLFKSTLKLNFQYDHEFRAPKLCNWQVPKWHPGRPIQRKNSTKIIANDRGHLIPGVPKYVLFNYFYLK